MSAESASFEGLFGGVLLREIFVDVNSLKSPFVGF